jgi:hypothetical protein
MFSIGSKVKIVRGNKNDFFDRKFLNHEGIITTREFYACGASGDDPMYVVDTDIGSDGFWTEELELIEDTFMKKGNVT